MPLTYRLNGEPRSWHAGTTIRQTLTDEGLDGAWFAVALNGAVVPASRWDRTTVPADGELEVIQPCQGG